MNILVLNAGSSTWKCALFKNDEIEPAWKGFLDFGKDAKAKDSIQEMIQTAWKGSQAAVPSPEVITHVGHRVVHGGAQFVTPTLITAEVKEAIRSLIPLAPLHNPANLEGILLMEKLLPQCKQVAVFDTAFHRSMPEEIQTYAIPLAWRKQGIRRYGFHGISHAYCTKRAATLLGKDPATLNLLSCHLGNGSSLTAVRQGKSYTTSMGFTPMEGLMMGTRSGSIDPGILLYLLQEKKMPAEELQELLNNSSGLFGIGGSSDMRQLLALKSQANKEAQLAYDMYISSLVWHMGAMLGLLGKPDAILFAGGIGENSSEIRQAACERFRSWGVELDEKSNREEGSDRCISTPLSSIPVFIIKTREDLEIARACVTL